MQTLLVGVDGGASKCTVRIEDTQGQLLGEAMSGPANIRLSVEQTWHSIRTALDAVLHPLGLSFEKDQARLQVGMGLAGSEVKEAYDAFLQKAKGFRTLIVASDAHTACLGAHNGNDGAVMIIGTGVIGLQIEQAHISKVGGFGFPHDDRGGGAWLGMQAIHTTLCWLDGRSPASELAHRVYEKFNCHLDHLVTWANQANSTAFAELAPLVIEQANHGDAKAIQLMKTGACAIDEVDKALRAKQIDQNTFLPCALVGGVAEFMQPYLGEALRERLRPCQLPPVSGAILLLREKIK